MLAEPFLVEEVAFIAALERVGAQVEELRDAHHRERFTPHAHPFVALLGEHHLPPANPQRQEVAVVAPVDETLTRAPARIISAWADPYL